MSAQVATDSLPGDGRELMASRKTAQSPPASVVASGHAATLSVICARGGYRQTDLNSLQEIYRMAANYSKVSHPFGDDYENWLAAEQAVYYKEVICWLVSA